jgi:hypothetical protein
MKVLFDKPYNEDNYKLEGHNFVKPASSDGAWAYTFSNITADPFGYTESLIRIELVVYDKAGKISDKYKMYFSVVPEGFGNVEPEVQFVLVRNLPCLIIYNQFYANQGFSISEWVCSNVTESVCPCSI